MNNQNHHQPLAEQRALVTGANTGIGAAVAESLADAGAKVVINYGKSGCIAGSRAYY